MGKVERASPPTNSFFVHPLLPPYPLSFRVSISKSPYSFSYPITFLHCSSPCPVMKSPLHLPSSLHDTPYPYPTSFSHPALLPLPLLSLPKLFSSSLSPILTSLPHPTSQSRPPLPLLSILLYHSSLPIVPFPPLPPSFTTCPLTLLPPSISTTIPTSNHTHTQSHP